MAEAENATTGQSGEPSTEGGQVNAGQASGTQDAAPKAALFNEPQQQQGGEEPQGQEGKPEGKSEEGKPEGEAAAPLTEADIAIPEGFTYDKELGDSFLGIVNDRELSRKDMINKLVGLYAQQQGKALDALKAADAERDKQFEAEMAKEKAEWLEKCKADPEYGGQNWEANNAVIDRGCKRLATPEAVELLQRYNLNTHPEIVRMFYRAGKLAGEDKSIGPGGSGGGKISAAEAIFGESLREYHRRKEAE